MSEQSKWVSDFCPNTEDHAEIARLRAEVERLTSPCPVVGHVKARGECPDCIEEWRRRSLQLEEELAALHDREVGWKTQTKQAERERDEALARIETLNATLNDIPCSGPSGCLALAQVVVLIQGIQKNWPSWPTMIYELNSLVTHLSPAALALLDRLQQVEQENKRLSRKVQGYVQTIIQRPFKLWALQHSENDAMPVPELASLSEILDRLQRAEAVVKAAFRCTHNDFVTDIRLEDWTALREALAAWEENKDS